MRQISHLMSIYVCLIMIQSCTSLPKPVDTSSMSVDDVGTVRTTVVSVGPWRTYIDLLQPEFKMSLKEALEKSVATTRRASLRQLNKSSAAFGIGAERKSLLSESKTVVDEQGDVTTTSDETITRTSGQIPDDISAGDDEPKLTTDKVTGDIDIDPRLHRHAATALYQEIQILDRYIKDAVSKYNYEPYLVRLQFNLMPRQHDLPLDAYINLSFFTGSDPDYEVTDLALKEMKTESKQEDIVILPIISTSNHESAYSTAIIQEIEDLKFKIESLSKTATGIDIGNIAEKVDSALARDINATFMVARLNDNTIRVKIGALQQLSSRYSMVPRTEYASFLMLVPHSHTQWPVEVKSYSEIINTLTGQPLAYKPDSRENNDIATILNEYFDIDVANVFPEEHGVVYDSDEFENAKEYIDHLWRLTLDNKYTEFRHRLDSMVCNSNNVKLNCEPYSLAFENIIKDPKDHGELKNYCHANKYRFSQRLWADLMFLQSGYISDHLHFELPKKTKPMIFPRQALFLFDDMKAKSTVKLYNGRVLRQNEVCASLVVFEENNDKTVKYNIPANSILIDSGGSNGLITFPSLKKYKLDNISKKAYKYKLRVAYDKGGTNACWNNHLSSNDVMIYSDNVCVMQSDISEYITAEAKKEKKIIGHKLVAANPLIAIQGKASGKLRLTVIPSGSKSEDSELILNVQGAIIDKFLFKPKDFKLKDNGNILKIKVPKNNKNSLTLDLTLDGLVDGENVMLTMRNKNGAKADPLKLNTRLVNKKSEKK